MPKTPKTSPAAVIETEATEIPRFLEDGRHPNPEYFSSDDRGFEDFQAALDEKDIWGEYIAYLYRVSPRRTPTDKEARVATFVSSLTIAEITKKYGGKKWSVWMNHGAGGRTRLVKKFQFDIEAAPIWQDDESPENPAAAGRSKNQPALPVEGAAKADPLVIKAFDDLIAQRDRALSQGESFDTGEALQRALALQNKGFESALTSVTANIGKGDSGLAAVLVPLLTELIKTNRKEDPVMQLLLERALEKPADPWAQITGMLTLLKELGVKIGSGRIAEAAAGGSDWAGLLEKVVDKAPEILAGAGRLIPQRGPASAAPPPRVVPTIASPVAPLPRTAAGNPATPEPGNAATAPGDLPPESNPAEASQQQQLADRVAQDVVKATIVRMLFNGDTGDDAAHFAKMAHEPLALTIYQLLKNDPVQLKSDPILSQAMTHMNVMQFAKEFIAYFEEEENPAGPIPPEPESAQPSAAA